MRPRFLRRLRRLDRAKGQSLIVTLIVLAFITTIMGSLSVALLVEARYASNQRRHIVAYYLAKAGTEVAVRELVADDPRFDGLSDFWHGGGKAPLKGNLRSGAYSVSYVSAETGEPWTGIVDEERKLNVNKVDRATLRDLHPAMTKDVVNAIIKQRVEAPFRRVAEVGASPGLVPGFLTTSRPGVPKGLGSLLTVYGDGKVNINTAPRQVLQSLEMIGAEQVDKLIECRNGKDERPGTEDDVPFTTLTQVQTTLEMSDKAFAKLTPWLKVSSEYFTIRSVGRTNGKPPASRELLQSVRRDRQGVTVLRFEQLR